jgi:aminoglycoside phosphotransferase (APT) family kinase protein
VRAARLPIAFEHRDASHPNLLRRSDGSLAAVDWERAEPEGLPLHDLSTFLAYVAVVRARTAARHDEGEVIASSLLAADGWAARALAEHSQRIGVEPGCIRALVTISLARLTMGLAERLEDDRTLPPSALTVDWLRGHRYHVAWRSVALAAGP